MIIRYFFPAFVYFGYMQLLWLMFAYVPLYLKSAGFTHLEISFLISLFSFLPLIVVIPFGIFSDRISPKRLVILGFILLSLFSLTIRFGGSFRSLLFLFVMGGLGSSIFLISCSSLYYKLLQGENQGKKIGFFTAMGNLGYGVGPLMGSLILPATTLPDLFVIIFLMSLPFLGLSFFLLDIKPEPFNFHLYWKDFSRFEVLVVAAITFLVSLHFGAERTTLTLFLKYNARVSEHQMGVIFFCVGITLATIIFSLGSLRNIHANLKMLFFIGLLLSGIFNIGMLFVDNFPKALTIRLLHVIGDSAYLLAQRIAISRLSPAHRVGGNIGIFDTTTTIGTFVGAFISGLLPGYVYPFVLTGVLSLIGAAALIFIKLTLEPRDR